MPNGYSYFLRSSEDWCLNCGEPLCNHDRERVATENDRFTYDYYCTDGSRYDSPIADEEEEEDE